MYQNNEMNTMLRILALSDEIQQECQSYHGTADDIDVSLRKICIILVHIQPMN